MENENVNVETGANVNQTNETGATEPKTFDDILANKEYQAEFDRRITKSIETARTKWQAELEAQKSEAEKLAGMKAEEKAQYELNKANAEKESAIAELEAYKLKDEVIKMANEKNIPVALVELIEFKGAKAEDVKTKLENINKIFTSELEKGLSNKLKEPERKQVNPTGTDEIKAYLDQKYGNNPYYKK